MIPCEVTIDTTVGSLTSRYSEIRELGIKEAEVRREEGRSAKVHGDRYAMKLTIKSFDSARLSKCGRVPSKRDRVSCRLPCVIALAIQSHRGESHRSCGRPS